jgi:alkaline phosphatase
MDVTRRTLIGSAAAGLAASSLGLGRMTGQRARRGRRPKNIIFCVVDGMAVQTLTMADHLQQLRDGRRSFWSTLLDRNGTVRAFQDTRSLNSIVTDSAAASSSWGSGRRVWNGQINEFPDGTQLRTLTSLMSEAGVRCGLVTTTTVTHATPAGFAVNAVQRDLEGLIAERYLKSGVSVLMGGGDRFFNSAQRKDGRDLYAEFGKAGYKVVRDRDGLLGAKGDKVLGIFSPSHMPFTVDRDNDPEIARATPTLAEMTRVALANLKGGRNGFLLQIEGGKVDHAAHGNDLAGMIYDQIAFEDALKVAMEFAERDGETLVIVTADHACGGPSLNGAGAEYIESTAGLKSVERMRSSYAPLFSAIGTAPTAGRVQDVVEAKLGVKLTADEAGGVVASIAGKSPFALSTFHASPNATLAMVLGNHTKVTWTSGNHTSDHVIVTAWGPGSEAVFGLTPNTSFFNMMLGFKGIKWSNPTMTFEEARRHYSKLKASIDPQWTELYAAHDECGCHGAHA